MLAVHLSYIPIIVQNTDLQRYLTAKLQLHLIEQVNTQRSKSSQEEDKPIPYTRAAQVERYDWKDKYRMVTKARTQLRLHQYYQHVEITGEPTSHTNSLNQNFVLQRTVGHCEIKANKIWLLSKSCYICNRDKYSIFVCN